MIFGRCSSKLVLSVFVTGIFCPGAVVRGDVLIDDFDEDASGGIVSLTGEGVETLGVGPLAFRRSVRLIQVNSQPIGGWQINTGEASTFTMDVGRVNPGPPTLGSIIGVNLVYDLPATASHASFDVSDGGLNNGFFVDFRSSSSEVPPPFLRIGVRDLNGWHFSVVRPVPQGDSPFSLAFRRETFTVRAGPVLPDFSQLQSISINLRALTSSNVEVLNFHAAIDRIRVGFVPEPDGAAPIAGAIAGLVHFLRRPLNKGEFHANGRSLCRRR